MGRRKLPAEHAVWLVIGLASPADPGARWRQDQALHHFDARSPAVCGSTTGAVVPPALGDRVRVSGDQAIAAAGPRCGCAASSPNWSSKRSGACWSPIPCCDGGCAWGPGMQVSCLPVSASTQRGTPSWARSIRCTLRALAPCPSSCGGCWSKPATSCSRLVEAGDPSRV